MARKKRGVKGIFTLNKLKMCSVWRDNVGSWPLEVGEKSVKLVREGGGSSDVRLRIL